MEQYKCRGCGEDNPKQFSPSQYRRKTYCRACMKYWRINGKFPVYKRLSHCPHGIPMDSTCDDCNREIHDIVSKAIEEAEKKSN